LRLDVLEDCKTPYYHVKGETDDDYLSVYPTFASAYAVFSDRVEELKKEITLVSTNLGSTEEKNGKGVLDKGRVKEELQKLMDNGKVDEAQLILNSLLRCTPIMTFLNL
jgi:hypothetical protein